MKVLHLYRRAWAALERRFVGLLIRLRGHGYSFDILTHLTFSEKILLYRLARSLRKDSVIVEVGSYLGASSVFLAIGAKGTGGVVYCVDTWANDAMSEGSRDTYQEFLSNTKRVADYIRPLRGRSLEMAAQFGESIDLLFVDGDHSYEAASDDLRAWLPKLKDGGVVVCHDYGWKEGVKRAVEELISPVQLSPGRLVSGTYWARVRGTRRDPL